MLYRKAANSAPTKPKVRAGSSMPTAADEELLLVLEEVVEEPVEPDEPDEEVLVGLWVEPVLADFEVELDEVLLEPPTMVLLEPEAEVLLPEDTGTVLLTAPPLAGAVATGGCEVTTVG